MPAKLIISGAPASGKGTQCEFIKKEYGVIHLSTGDILREAIKAETPVGLRAKEYVENGKLVPDEVICEVVLARVLQSDCAQNGWLLDGFPRTGGQAEALAKAGMTCDAFIQMDVPDELLLERVTGRRLDPETGKIYHLKFSPPETEEIANRLLHRADDTEEKFGGRLTAYHENLGSILALFSDKILPIKVASGAQSPDAIFVEIKLALMTKIAPPKEDAVAISVDSSLASKTTTEIIGQSDAEIVTVAAETANAKEVSPTSSPDLTVTSVASAQVDVAIPTLSADKNPVPVTATDAVAEAALQASAVETAQEIIRTDTDGAKIPTVGAPKIIAPNEAVTKDTAEPIANSITEPIKSTLKDEILLAPPPSSVPVEQPANVRTRSASDSEAVQPLSGLPVGSAMEAVRKLSVQPTVSVA